MVLSKIILIMFIHVEVINFCYWHTRLSPPTRILYAYFTYYSLNLGTNFNPVFEKIIEQVQGIDSDLVIIFFTDGEGSYSDDVKSKLEVALAQTGFTTEIHTIGYTETHDAGKYDLYDYDIFFLHN